MWSDFFAAGGWGMIPTLAFGFLLIASGVLLMLRPERRFLRLVASLGILTFGSGVLGTVTGLVNTFRYVPRVPSADQLKIVVLGTAESLNNLVLALILLVLTSLLGSIAALRAARATPPAANPR